MFLLQVLLMAGLAAPISTGQIAFLSGVDVTSTAVHRLDLGSGEIRQVGPGPSDGPPHWSPDGRWLAFETATEEGRGIWVCGPAGAEGRLVSGDYAWNARPRWSPDGRRLVYVAADTPGFGGRLVVCDIETNDERVWGGGGQVFLQAEWLYDYDLVEFMSLHEQYAWLRTDPVIREELKEGCLVAVGLAPVSRGLSTDIALVSVGRFLWFPQWGLPSEGDYAEWNVAPGPDGKRVLFESNDGGDREVFLLTKKGAYDVSNHRTADINPKWAPKGKWFAFESWRGGRRGIYRMYYKTPNVQTLAASPEWDNWSPDWSPDGRALVFVSNRGHRPQLYVCDRRGDHERRLTELDTGALAPAWRPGGGEK